MLHAFFAPIFNNMHVPERGSSIMTFLSKLLLPPMLKLKTTYDGGGNVRELTQMSDDISRHWIFPECPEYRFGCRDICAGAKYLA